jgi:hypothetical protein
MGFAEFHNTPTRETAGKASLEQLHPLASKVEPEQTRNPHENHRSDSATRPIIKGDLRPLLGPESYGSDLRATDRVKFYADPSRGLRSLSR